jgi:capsule polysaccharide export protein KpsE/RkpR
LLETYSPDNVRVRAVEARNAELQRQMDELRVRPQGDDSKANGTKFAYPAASQLPALGLTYYALQRRVLTQEELWEALTKEYEAAKVQEAAELPEVRVLDPANVPQRKSGPNRRLIVIVGTMISCALACLCVFAVGIWEGMDPEDEPKKLLFEAFGKILHSRP